MTPTIDSKHKTRGHQCYWCHKDTDQLHTYGTRHEGQTYWSPALCSRGCHTEMYSG